MGAGPELQYTARAARRSEFCVNIDIEKLTKAELIALNHRIVERLKTMDKLSDLAQMLQFHAGDRVTFQPDGLDMLRGTVIKCNQKTVTVLTEGGQQWKVSPGLLQKEEKARTSDGAAANVLRLPKK